MCLGAIKKDGYLNVYFHPWEFADLRAKGVNLPSYIVRNSGIVLVERLSEVIDCFKENNYQFGTLKQCLDLYPRNL